MHNDSNRPELPDGSIEVSVHAAPRFWPFLITGLVLGVLAGVVIALLGPGSESFTRAATAGFFGFFGALTGVFLAGLAFIVIDKITARRTQRRMAVPNNDSTSEDSGNESR